MSTSLYVSGRKEGGSAVSYLDKRKHFIQRSEIPKIYIICLIGASVHNKKSGEVGVNGETEATTLLTCYPTRLLVIISFPLHPPHSSFTSSFPPSLTTHNAVAVANPRYHPLHPLQLLHPPPRHAHPSRPPNLPLSLHPHPTPPRRLRLRLLPPLHHQRRRQDPRHAPPKCAGSGTRWMGAVEGLAGLGFWRAGLGSRIGERKEKSRRLAAGGRADYGWRGRVGNGIGG